MRSVGFDFGEQAGVRVHDETAHDEVGRHEGMVAHKVDTLAHGCLRGVETGEPVLEVDAAVRHHVDMIGRDAAAGHLADKFGGVHVLGAAVSVSDDHDFFDAKLVDGYDEAAYHAVERLEHDAAGHLDELDVAVAQAERGGQELDKACVHTGNDGYFLVGIFRRDVGFIGFPRYELLIIAEQFVNHGWGVMGVGQKIKKHPGRRIRATGVWNGLGLFLNVQAARTDHLPVAEDVGRVAAFAQVFVDGDIDGDAEFLATVFNDFGG